MRRFTSLSSTMRTGPPPAGSGRSPTTAGNSAVSSATVKWKVLPVPGVLSSQMRPPIRWTRVDEIASPRPVPPNWRVVDASAWLNASKTLACFSTGIPMPVSATRKCSRVHPSPRESSRTATITCPRSVNLMALPARFVRICFNRTGSPITPVGMSGAMSTRISSPFSSARTASGFNASPIASASENGIDSRSSLRDSILEKSRMSLRIVSRDSADPLTVLRQSD